MQLADFQSRLEEAAEAQPPVVDRLAAAVRGGRRRRATRRLATVLGVGAVLVGGLTAWPGGGARQNVTTATSRTDSSELLPLGEPCPGSVIRRIDGGDPVADALPERSDAVTDRAQAELALATNRAALEDRYRTSDIRVGAGFGRAWEGENGGAYDVVDVDDFGLLVTVSSHDTCPTDTDLYVSVDGVPLFFFVDDDPAQTTAPGDNSGGAQLAPGTPEWPVRSDEGIHLEGLDGSTVDNNAVAAWATRHSVDLSNLVATPLWAALVDDRVWALEAVRDLRSEDGAMVLYIEGVGMVADIPVEPAGYQIVAARIVVDAQLKVFALAAPGTTLRTAPDAEVIRSGDGWAAWNQPAVPATVIAQCPTCDDASVELSDGVGLGRIDGG